MRLIKRIVQWTIGIICGFYLCLQIVMRIPVVQEYAGVAVSSLLSDLWDWNIAIKRIRLGLWNRVIIDDVNLKDKQDSTLLHASRLAAKIDILPFLEGKVSIANIQLFGTQAKLYQSSPEAKPNFQFILDTFSSNDTTSSPLNLHIGSILLRRVDVSWDRQWIPQKTDGTMDINHLHLNDIALTAHLRTLQEDSLNIALKRLSINESNGFTLKNMTFDLNVGKNSGELNNFKILLPNSSLDIPSIHSKWDNPSSNSNWKTWIQNVAMNGNMQMELLPSDLKSIYPNFKIADKPIMLTTHFMVIDSCLNVPRLNLTNHGSLDLETGIFIKDLISSPNYMVEIRNLTLTSAFQQFITKTLKGREDELSPILTCMDTINIRGLMQFSKQEQQASLLILNHAGNLNIKAKAKEWNSCEVAIKSEGIELNKLLSDNGIHAFGKVELDASLKCFIDDVNKPNISLHTKIPKAIIQNREYNDLQFYTTFKNELLTLKTNIDDHEGTISALINLKVGKKTHIFGDVAINSFHTDRLGLGERYPDKRLTLVSNLDVSGNDIDNLTGCLNISDFNMHNGCRDSLYIEPMQLSISCDINNKSTRTLSITSKPFNLTAQGDFKFTTLFPTISNHVQSKLPNIIPYIPVASPKCNMSFMADIEDTVLLRKIALMDIVIPERLKIKGNISSNDSISLSASIPQISIGKEWLRNSNINVRGSKESVIVNASTERRQKKGFSSIKLLAKAAENRLRLIANTDNNHAPKFAGELDLTANFLKTSNGMKDIRVWVAPTEMVISDTVWQIHPARLHWDSQTASIYGVKVSQGNSKSIEINGKLSEDEQDTLDIELQQINVGYILDLVNFHSVEFDGSANGKTSVTGILSNPKANVSLIVDNFTFNYAPLGTLYANANWGDTQNFLSLNADIVDSTANHKSLINGGFNIGHPTIPDGLDLRVNTKGFNLAFLNFFTEDIFKDFRGRASGHCRIFGPFSAVDLEGDMQIDHADCIMPMLGTAYHLQKDSVHLRPGSINIKALLMDSYAHPYEQYEHSNGNLPHTALLEGGLMFNHFKNLRYNFNATANKFLGYDFREFGENSFYATCYATGTIGIHGESGRLTVDINATPEAGTSFTYNVNTPEALTEAGFITFTNNEYSKTSVQHSSGVNTDVSSDNSSSNHSLKQDEPAVSSDLFINFNLQMTPDAKVRLLMDRKSGDIIEIGGRGRIMAKFHNKGKFNIFGTYRVQDGTYRFSLQDIIRKEFKFQPDGLITFGGDPMKADLAMKATYSVQGVSLDDLSSSPLGFSKTQVDCIMNLTGRPEHPVVTFDFDLPNVTEDERQMIRSIVRTEEERNMQAIYLLGLGRFYNLDAAGQEQSTIAMNSLLSSTLSTHLNQFLSNATGTDKWNIGTSIKTGEDGWSNVDVEGMLSGKLLDNRLLLTGNFGYREKNYTQRNFITDVSVEYLLTKNGSISLKAYNQANDRYFVQSSLNTQGIGIQFRRDFNHFTDMLYWLRRKKQQ